MIMFLEAVLWWYGKGWISTLGRINKSIQSIWQMFSVSILLKTLFNPWRRIVSLPGKGIDAMMRAMVDNLISRLVGFITRILVLIAAFIVTTITVAIGALMAVSWLVLPLATIYCVIRIFI